MAVKRREEEPKAGCPEWMATYGDFITLLLTFFVLLFAMSSVDVQKFQAISLSLQGALGLMPDNQSIMEPIIEQQQQVAEEIKEIMEEEVSAAVLEAINLEEVRQQIQEYIDENYLSEQIEVQKDVQKGVIIRFKDNVLFDTGSADIKPDSYTFLDNVTDILTTVRQNIRIEGHTDSRPINTGRFPSNWELSTQRAANVLKYIISNGHIPPEKMSAEGFAEFRPIAPNDSQDNMQKNRRVDIVIIREYREPDAEIQ